MIINSNKIIPFPEKIKINKITKIPKIILTFLISIILIIKIKSQTQTQKDNQDRTFLLDDDDARYYANEICSYNQDKITYNEVKNSITCVCSEDFLTLNPNNNLRFGEHPIQCNYRKKRGYIVFFYSVFSLFGFEHLYLGRYYSFIIIFTVYSSTILVNLYFLIATNFKKDIFANKVFINIIKKIFEKMFYVWYFIYIGNLVLVLTHTYKDGNDQVIMWDIQEFISV
jgi:hypothetical protein